MNYSETKRKIFFWILVLLFSITAPTLIFYTMGYRFSFERGIFIYSGSFTIKSTPQETEISIDNEKVSRGMVNFLNYSFHIDGLKPGTYNLEVSAPGYQSWHKRSAIHSGLSTEFWNIFLAREKYTRKQYNTNSIKNFFISPKEKNIAIVENVSDLNISVLNIEEDLSADLFSTDKYYFSNESNENIEWSPEGTQLIIPAVNKETQEKEYFISDTTTKKTINLNELLDKKNIVNARWDYSRENIVFYISDGSLYQSNLENKENPILLTDNVGGYDISKNEIYIIKKPTGIIYEINSDSIHSTRQITTTSIENINFDKLKMIVYDEGRIAIIDGDKDFYIFNKGKNGTYFNKLSEKIEGVHFSNDGKKITYWSNNELFVYFVRDWDTQPVRYENQNFDITRSIDKISNVQWLKDYEHILFTSDNKVKIIEIDHRDYRNTATLESVNVDTKAVYNQSGNFIYFTDSNINNPEITNLWSIDLLEENQ